MNPTHPEVPRVIHRQYPAAGADIMTTAVKHLVPMTWHRDNLEASPWQRQGPCQTAVRKQDTDMALGPGAHGKAVFSNQAGLIWSLRQSGQSL